jgi:hypothetical protein
LGEKIDCQLGPVAFWLIANLLRHQKARPCVTVETDECITRWWSEPTVRASSWVVMVVEGSLRYNSPQPKTLVANFGLSSNIQHGNIHRIKRNTSKVG